MILKLASFARILAGVASLAAAAWWAGRAIVTWWMTRPIRDAEFGLRLTPLSPAERAAALEREEHPDPESAIRA